MDITNKQPISKSSFPLKVKHIGTTSSPPLFVKRRLTLGTDVPGYIYLLICLTKDEHANAL